MLTGKEICPLEETANICVFIYLCHFLLILCHSIKMHARKIEFTT